jgi:hypothetical protein
MPRSRRCSKRRAGCARRRRSAGARSLGTTDRNRGKLRALSWRAWAAARRALSAIGARGRGPRSSKRRKNSQRHSRARRCCCWKPLATSAPRRRGPPRSFSCSSTGSAASTRQVAHRRPELQPGRVDGRATGRDCRAFACCVGLDPTIARSSALLIGAFACVRHRVHGRPPRGSADIEPSVLQASCAGATFSKLKLSSQAQSFGPGENIQTFALGGCGQAAIEHDHRE